MKTLITGSSGFIGQALVSKFLDSGCEVFSLSRVKKGSDSKNLKHIALDLQNISKYGQAIIPSTDIVVHLAAKSI